MQSISEAIIQAAFILMAAITLVDTATTHDPDDGAHIAHAAQGMARIMETMAAPRPA